MGLRFGNSSGDSVARRTAFFAGRGRGRLGLASGLTGRSTKPGCQEGNKVFQVFGNIPRVAPSLREGLDSVGTSSGVVDRAEHEMKPPEHFVACDFGQAFAKRVDKRGAREVKILGDQLVEQGCD